MKVTGQQRIVLYDELERQKGPGWQHDARFTYLEEHFAKMLRKATSQRQAARFAIARCENLYEQRERRASHDTGCEL